MSLLTDVKKRMIRTEGKVDSMKDELENTNIKLDLILTELRLKTKAKKVIKTKTKEL